ncbi:MAG: hypothetical protein MUF72_01180 [Elainella sp. Prado103]|nr:hypothetical protein [Elainella sp. Prado103]
MNGSSISLKQIEKAIEKSAKTVIAANGIYTSTRSGSKELNHLIKRVSSQLKSLTAAHEFGEALGRKIVTLSQETKRQNLDQAVIRQLIRLKQLPNPSEYTTIDPPVLPTTPVTKVVQSPSVPLAQLTATDPTPSATEEPEIQDLPENTPVETTLPLDSLTEADEAIDRRDEVTNELVDDRELEAAEGLEDNNSVNSLNSALDASELDKDLPDSELNDQLDELDEENRDEDNDLDDGLDDEFDDDLDEESGEDDELDDESDDESDDEFDDELDGESDGDDDLDDEFDDDLDDDRQSGDELEDEDEPVAQREDNALDIPESADPSTSPANTEDPANTARSTYPETIDLEEDEDIEESEGLVDDRSSDSIDVVMIEPIADPEADLEATTGIGAQQEEEPLMPLP